MGDNTAMGPVYLDLDRKAPSTEYVVPKNFFSKFKRERKMNEAQDDAINSYMASTGFWLSGAPRRVREAICEVAMDRGRKQCGKRVWSIIHYYYPGLYAGTDWISDTLGPEMYDLCRKHK